MKDNTALINKKMQANSLYYLDPNPNGTQPLLLLHGLGAEATSWAAQFSDFVHAGIRPIAPDIPGFGLSKFQYGRWTVNKAVKEIVKFLDVLGISSTCVLGLSMGGALALSMALNHPERVQRLILASTFAHLRPRNLSQTIYFIKRFFITMSIGGLDQAEIVAHRVFPRADQQILRNILIENIRETNPHVYRQALLSLGMHNVRHKLKRINCHTLVIIGEDDTTVTKKCQMELVQGIQDASHVIITDAGHAVSIDQPQRFNFETINFIKGSNG